jgi:hypothetical protein
MDFARDISESKALEEVYSLPDGKAVVLSKERVRVPELLFDPTLNVELWGLKKAPLGLPVRSSQKTKQD